ncbi:MAG: WXG100 family type VII secretion target [Acidimicrobiales bacterium]
MTIPSFDGNPEARRAAASLLERLADDLRSQRDRIHEARQHLGGARWSGPASVAFDQSVWWLGAQLYTAFDSLERGGAAMREYAGRLEDELAAYDRAVRRHGSHTDGARMAETPDEAERHATVAAQAAGRADAAFAASQAAGDRCAQVLAEVGPHLVREPRRDPIRGRPPVPDPPRRPRRTGWHHRPDPVQLSLPQPDPGG